MTSGVDRATAYRLFCAAFELPPAQRLDYLATHCAGNELLHAEVARYLCTAERDPIETRAILDPPRAEEASLVGQTLGRFRLVERIGQGGMGIVYRAERIEGVEQSVAVKVISTAIDESGRNRFRQEAQLLARIEHPSIARLIDSGIDDARAWIAIEFVRGEPIDVYCRNHDLPLRSIVELLAELADAVAAAHAMLVIHSDIKPANVLVNTEGRAKLIDFGISTALRDAGNRAEATVNSARLFTPHYAAPEQVRGEPVTAATDVFGLGALAYRLLSGRHAHADAEGAAYLLAVTQRDVERPSVASTRAAVPATRLRELRGDLDAIVTKALERDPRRRYASAASMAADLRRYLANRPVLAQAPTPTYRLGKFLRRNAVAVSLATLAAVSLLTGTALSIAQARKAAIARDESRAVTAFLTNDILAAANPMIAGSRDVLLRPLLDAASQQLDSRFAGQPRVRAQIQAAMGTGYAALFDAEKSERLLTAAETGLAREFGDAAEQTQSVRLALWYLYLGRIDMPKLMQLSRRMSAAENTVGRQESANALRGRMMVAAIPCMRLAHGVVGFANCGDVVKPFYEQARSRFGPDARLTHEVAWFLGVTYLYSSREELAETALRTACAGLERDYGSFHHRLTACRRFLARALDANGRSVESLSLYPTIVKNFTTTLGPDSIFPAIANYEYSITALHAGAMATAASAARSAVATLGKPACDCVDDWRRARIRLGEIQVASGDRQEGLRVAQSAYREALVDSSANPTTIIPMRSMVAEVYRRAGNLPGAESLMRENLAASAALKGRPTWLTAQLQAVLANLLIAEHRDSEARELLRQAVPVLTSELGSANFRTASAARALQDLG